MLSPKKRKVLEALLKAPTQQEAARLAGVDTKTVYRYLQDPEFQAEYRKAVDGVIGQATKEAQAALSPAIQTLREIMQDVTAGSMPRISAARALLEFGLRLTEIVDILSKIEGADNNVL